MPKPRKVVVQDSCGFCGTHKDEAPLVITSQIPPNPAICCICALGVVQQTFLRFGELDKQIRKQMTPPPRPTLAVVDTASAAIEKAKEKPVNGDGQTG
jgi:hypothetical protein